MVAFPNIQIDARNVRQIAAILMALKEKVAAVVEPSSWPTGISPEDEIQVLIRLSFRGVTQQPKIGDDAGWVFKWERTVHKGSEFVPCSNAGSWRTNGLPSLVNGGGNRSNSGLGDC